MQYQRKIQQLEDIVNEQKKLKIEAMEEARIAYDSLKNIAITKETEHRQELQQERKLSN